MLFLTNFVFKLDIFVKTEMTFLLFKKECVLITDYWESSSQVNSTIIPI